MTPPMPEKPDKPVGETARVTFKDGRVELVDVGRPLLIADVFDMFEVDDQSRPNAYRVLLWTVWVAKGRPGLNGAAEPAAVRVIAESWIDENIANLEVERELPGPPTKSRGKSRT